MPRELGRTVSESRPLLAITPERRWGTSTRAGDTVRARKVLDTLKTRWNEQERRGTEAEGLGGLAANLASVYIGLGDTAQALRWLEEAVDRRAGYVLYLAADPTYKPLHQSRRFRALLERIGLPTS